MANIYSVGQVVRCSTTITVGGTNTDPSTLALTYRDPTGAETTVTYANSQIVKDAVGQYHYDIAVNYAGTYQLRWVGTGTAAGAQQDSFVVQNLNV